MISVENTSATGDTTPRRALFFDCLRQGDDSIATLTTEERHRALVQSIPPALAMPRLVTDCRHRLCPPGMVVEIAFSDFQASSRYPGGLALRLARVKRYRDDKRVDETDTMQSVRQVYAAQSAHPTEDEL